MQLINEAKVFEKTVQMLDQLMADPNNVPVIGEFLVLLVRETETAYVVKQTGAESIVAASLRSIKNEKIRKIVQLLWGWQQNYN